MSDEKPKSNNVFIGLIADFYPVFPIIIFIAMSELLGEKYNKLNVSVFLILMTLTLLSITINSIRQGRIGLGGAVANRYHTPFAFWLLIASCAVAFLLLLAGTFAFLVS